LVVEIRLESGYSTDCTGRSCDIQNYCNIFPIACCIQPITSVINHLWSRYTTLGLAEPLNYGLSMPPTQLRREWGMMRHFVAADSPAAAVRGQVGW